MFYKIDPTRRQMTFDLVADGFLAGDRIPGRPEGRLHAHAERLLGQG